MRQVVLDTETTGLEPKQGHRIIEIGCVELVGRKHTGRHYHVYINPEREVDQGAIAVHGITNEFLADKPRFAEICSDFIEFIRGAELVIHNAPFDIGFIDHEFGMLDASLPAVGSICGVVDTLVMARGRHPGQKNNLDALCKRYGVDNSSRELHGALLDAEILADLYLVMTGGQTSLSLGGGDQESAAEEAAVIRRLASGRLPLPVIPASVDELSAHEAKLDEIAAKGECLWRGL
ncbi:DNA polymerase III subunit epsilon [Aestuariirhabdus litorea]|uniref:DNA polymerase III subunit epsilon n=1 Tax=Aestuariirhabdus litorea TaxID=2528527 RepID=A0A3P3VQ25_9GAMM|nr:DNA polymerase III subunit epsilon [Aestuariirhabdus litorea]RRJ84891.1 DNA polymerase III subunit epsilon [Aestuariirhabdus litorea]RWW98117.1 DNA polymerase III subunit epsilon [Endozoicomonadaceae bacterium GTF-13]